MLVLVPGPRPSARGCVWGGRVTVEYPQRWGPLSRAHPPARRARSARPRRPAPLCPGNTPQLRESAASAFFFPPIPGIAFARTGPLCSPCAAAPRPEGARRERECAPEVTRGAPAPRLFRRAPRPGPSLGRAPLPLGGALFSVSRCPPLSLFPVLGPRVAAGGFLPSHLSARTPLARAAGPASSLPPPPSFPSGPEGLCRVAGAWRLRHRRPPRQDGHRRGR